MRVIHTWPEPDQAVFLDGLPILSRVFWGPDTLLCAALRDSLHQEQLRKLGGLAGAVARAATEELLAYVNRFSGPEDLCRALEETYVTLFVSARDGVAAPLYQSFYESAEGLLMGPAALRMEQRLLSAGISGRANEPADHLALEIEYLFLLLERGLETPDVRTLEVAIRFAQDELATWLPCFVRRLGTVSSDVFYPAAARALQAAVACITAPSSPP